MIAFAIAVATMSQGVKRDGAGKANWGRPGDELDWDPIDERDPNYDSADELFENAFGSTVCDTQYDWAGVVDISDDDHSAMNEIEEQMRQDWLSAVETEMVDIQDEGEAFFSQT